MLTALQTALASSRLTVDLRQDGDVRFLDMRSRVDPTQAFLLPVRPQSSCAGLAGFTRLGRLHALHWGFAYGSGPFPDGALVRFMTSRPYPERAVEVVPHSLGEQCWVADAEGIFDSAALVLGEEEVDRVRLAPHF